MTGRSPALGDIKKAMEFFRLGLGIAKETGHRNSEGTGYNNLGAVYHSLGDFKKAMEFYGLGLGIAKETGDRESESGQICLLPTQFCPISPLQTAFNDII